MIKSVYRSSNFPLYLLLFFSAYLLNFTDLEFITTEEIYNAYQEDQVIEKYGDTYTDEFLDDLEEGDYDELSTADYLSDLAFDAVFVFIDTIRIPYIAFFLLIIFELIYPITEVRFSKLLKTVIVAEFIFIFQNLIQQVYLVLFKPDYTMEDIIYSKPLALSSLLGSNTPNEGLVGYLVDYADFFEVFYVGVLAYGLAYMYEIKFSKIVGWVLLAYVASQVFTLLLSVLIFDVLL